MNIVTLYALQFIGINYKWGGNNAVSGFDCSGYVQEILSAIGMDPPGRDTAQSLYDHFSKNGTLKVKPQEGDLIFYGTGTAGINHIAYCMNESQILEAGGGGSQTTSIEAAAKTSAVVRSRLYDRRKDIVAIITPNYPDWVNK